mgnify:CR=1 FL=1
MVATMMAGVLLILLGIFKLGTIIKFIPYPIIVGFTSGIAVTIFTTQIADIFGLQFGGEKVPGRLYWKMDFIFSSFRHCKLVECDRQFGKYLHHRHHS